MNSMKVTDIYKKNIKYYSNSFNEIENFDDTANITNVISNPKLFCHQLDHLCKCELVFLLLIEIYSNICSIVNFEITMHWILVIVKTCLYPQKWNRFSYNWWKFCLKLTEYSMCISSVNGKALFKIQINGILLEFISYKVSFIGELFFFFIKFFKLILIHKITKQWTLSS